jgi:hypothetical protein
MTRLEREVEGRRTDNATKDAELRQLKARHEEDVRTMKDLSDEVAEQKLLRKEDAMAVVQFYFDRRMIDKVSVFFLPCFRWN